MSPPRQVQRASWHFGVLVAMGLAGRGEALDHLTVAAAGTVAQSDRNGLRARLAHLLDDATGEAARLRCFAPRRVQAALAPLLADLASRAALIEAGFAAAGEVVMPAEARLLVEDAVRRHLAGVR